MVPVQAYSKGWELTRKTLRLLLWATKHCTCPCSMSCKDRVQIFSGSSKSNLQAGMYFASGHLIHVAADTKSQAQGS